MVRKLIATVDVDIDGRTYPMHYYEHTTARGARRFSCEVLIDASDRIIVDDDSMTSLESKVMRLAPATVYSRALAARRSVAA